MYVHIQKKCFHIIFRTNALGRPQSISKLRKKHEMFTFWTELYTWDENYCIFATENLKLTAHVQWQENSEILQLKFMCVHNSRNNCHRMELLMFNRDRVKISLAFVFIVAFVTRDFYGKEKIVKHTQIYSWIACPVCFKLSLSFINIIKICTNRSTNVPNTWLIANKLGQLTCINGRRFQSCSSNNSQFLLFTGSTTKDVEREFEVLWYYCQDALWNQRVCYSSSHSSHSFCCNISFKGSASYNYKWWQTTP